MGITSLKQDNSSRFCLALMVAATVTVVCSKALKYLWNYKGFH